MPLLRVPVFGSSQDLHPPNVPRCSTFKTPNFWSLPIPAHPTTHHKTLQILYIPLITHRDTTFNTHLSPSSTPKKSKEHRGPKQGEGHPKGTLHTKGLDIFETFRNPGSWDSSGGMCLPKGTEHPTNKLLMI